MKIPVELLVKLHAELLVKLQVQVLKLQAELQVKLHAELQVKLHAQLLVKLQGTCCERSGSSLSTCFCLMIFHPTGEDRSDDYHQCDGS